MNSLLALGFMGGTEMLLIFAAVLLLFGAKRLPELAKGLGTSIKEFKKATREVTDEIHNAGSDVPPPTQPRLAAATPTPPPATVAQTPTPPKA